MKKSPRTTLPFAAVTSIAAAAVAAAHRATAERAPQAPKRRGRPLNAKPFQTAGRSSWFAHPTLPNGTRPSKSFESEEAAVAWIADRYESAAKAQQPALGGPDVATVAQALYKYAFQFTVVKGGAEAELTRIDNDLRGGGCRQDRARAARTLLIGCRSDHWTARSSRTLPLRAWTADIASTVNADIVGGASVCLHCLAVRELLPLPPARRSDQDVTETAGSTNEVE